MDRYDREDNTFHQLINIQFVAAMGPPGGGRNSVTPRYMRHYNVLSILDFDNASLTVVFTIIVDWWARKTRFPHDVRGSSLKDFLFPRDTIRVNQSHPCFATYPPGLLKRCILQDLQRMQLSAEMWKFYLHVLTSLPFGLPVLFAQ